jgi:hypothetical protein
MDKTTIIAETPRAAAHTGWQKAAPILALLLLSPVIAEVLSGSTRVTTLFVLIPSTGVWGCAALMIRNLVRSRRRGWLSILLLGIGLAIAEECVIQQTSLTPLIGIDPSHVYGRAFGVNWFYLLWALGFESIWAVVVPIQLAELIFPDRRDVPWLGKRGMTISAVIFTLAAFVAWYSWTQIYLPQFYPGSVYPVSMLAILIGLVAIAGCIAAAFAFPSSALPWAASTRPAPKPWQAGLAAFWFSLPWFLMVLIAYSALPALPVVLPVLVSILLAVGIVYLLHAWSARPGWQDAHRLALVFGVVAATLLGGFIVLSVEKTLMIDRIGQIVFNLGMLVGLIVLSKRAQFRVNR